MLLVVAIALPLIVTQPSRHLLYTTIIVFALCGLSLTILTGWAGQLSLGQMAFAGLGAFLAAALHRGITVDIGWRDTRIVDAGLVVLEGAGHFSYADSPAQFSAVARRFLLEQPREAARRSAEEAAGGSAGGELSVCDDRAERWRRGGAG